MNNLPKKDSATYRGLITSLQGFIGAFITVMIGLWAAINSVPGCADVIADFIYNNVLLLAGSFGVSSGAVSFFYNWLFRHRDVKTY